MRRRTATSVAVFFLRGGCDGWGVCELMCVKSEVAHSGAGFAVLSDWFGDGDARR